LEGSVLSFYGEHRLLFCTKLRFSRKKAIERAPFAFLFFQGPRGPPVDLIAAVLFIIPLHGYLSSTPVKFPKGRHEIYN